MNLKELKKEIPYKWKVQTAKQWGCDCVAYIDARDVMDLLDEVVGPENWQDSFREIGGKMYCTLSIKIGDEWIHKEDIGTPSNMDADKGEASDAFKRAAVKWGIGRFLYDLGIVKIKETICTNPEAEPKYRKYVPAQNCKRIYDVTAHVLQNNLYQPKQQAPTGNQPEEKKTGYTPRPKATPVPEPEATQVQRDEINMLSGALRWNGADFTAYLKQEKLNWDTLKKSEAHNLINNLQAMLPTLKDKTYHLKADAADSQGMSTIGQREEIQDLCAKKNSGGKKFQDLLKEQGYTWAKLTYDQAEKIIKILKAK